MRSELSSFVISQVTGIPVAEWRGDWTDGGDHIGFSAVTAKGHPVRLRRSYHRRPDRRSTSPSPTPNEYATYVAVEMEGRALAEQKADALLLKTPLHALWNRLMRRHDVARIQRERGTQQVKARRQAELEELRSRF